MYLSEKNRKKLKEWGYNDDLSENEKESKILLEEHFNQDYLKPIDLREIICDVEMAKKFFGINSYKKNGYVEDYNVYFKHTTGIKDWLLNDRKEEAEAYLMKHTVFNPDNKS